MKSVRPSSAPIVLGRVLLLLLMLLAGDALAASFTGDENDCRFTCPPGCDTSENMHDA